MSLRLRVLNKGLRWVQKPHLARVRSIAVLRRRFEIEARLFFPMPRHVAQRNEVLSEGSRAVPALWLGPKGAAKDALILYFHGGAYVFGSPRTHRAIVGRLAVNAGVNACLPHYRLAPEHAFPAALDDAVAAYRAVLAAGMAPERVILGGDSAGGGLVLALLGEICARGLPQPAGTFAISPLTDLTGSGASLRENAQADVVLPVARITEMHGLYLQGADPRDARASPLFAGFAGAGAVWLAVGDTEILRDDSRRMAAHLRSFGAEVTLLEARDHPHVWPLFQGPLLPEANETLRDLAGWITDRLHLSRES